MARTKQAPVKKAVSSNPFEIKTDMVLTGNRASGYSEFLPLFKESILKLPVGDKKASVNIPITVCPDKNTAANLVLSAKRQLRTEKGLEKIYLTCKVIKDAKNNYLCTRVWRLA